LAFTWSPQQNAIFDHFGGKPGNLTVRARAGTGKTTTILEGISHSKDFSILLAAFNKRIAVELQEKLKNPKAQAKTLHSLGFGCCMREWGKLNVSSDKGRARALAIAAVGSDQPKAMISLIAKLHTIAREVLPFAKHPDELDDLAFDFDCIPEDHWHEAGWDTERICEYAIGAMELARSKTDTIDFSDMLYLPVVNGWARPRFDLVCIDEAQDMNACQLYLAQGVVKKKGRIVVVGDDRQAIYGFRGADSDAIDRLKAELHADELPLSTTYRCPKLVVREAQRIVPDYEAAPGCPDGIVRSTDLRQIVSQVEPGNFVLSRSNAPLVKTCLMLLKQSIRARIEGRDIGQRLANITKNISKGADSMALTEFLSRLTTWRDREIAKALKADKESRAQLVQDQAETLQVLSEDLENNTVTGLKGRIDFLFGDAAKQHGTVVCSTVHKAKGLEADRVFILRDTLYPGKNSRMKIEEQNIEYVAITRAMKELVWVNGRF
jgi:superfamily I DNA/RNA helicase